MTQLIADVLKRDEEERLRRETADVCDILIGPGVYYDGTLHRVRNGDAAGVQAGQMAAMRRNPFEAWMGASPVGIDIAEFAMPTPAWGDAEYRAAMARYRAP